MSGGTPGQAAYDAWWNVALPKTRPFDGPPEAPDSTYEQDQEAWDAAGRAGAEADPRWPRCPDGCECRLGTEDADARECGCDGPCTAECRENGYPDAPSYRDLAVEAVAGNLREALIERDEARTSRSALRSAIRDVYATPSAVYLNAIGTLCAALRDIRDCHDAGTAAHDLAHKALDDIDHIRPQAQLAIELERERDEARASLREYQVALITNLATVAHLAGALRKIAGGEYGSASLMAAAAERALADRDAVTSAEHKLADVASERDELREHAASLEEDLDDAGATIADYRRALGAMQRQLDRARAVVSEMREHIVSGDDYADPAKIAGWDKRAGLDGPDSEPDDTSAAERPQDAREGSGVPDESREASASRERGAQRESAGNAAVRLLARIVQNDRLVMEAARIEMHQNGPQAAMQWVLNALPMPGVWDGEPGTEWDGRESAQAWFDRVTAGAGPAAVPLPAAGESEVTGCPEGCPEWMRMRYEQGGDEPCDKDPGTSGIEGNEERS